MAVGVEAPAEQGSEVRAAPHWLRLGDTQWWVWRDLLVRTAGFPIDGLDPFAGAGSAAAADALLAEPPRQPGEPESGAAAEFGSVFADELAAGATAIGHLAADPLLREAVTWQNRGVLVALDGLAAGAGEAARNVRRRDREKALLRYWQRYCAKNETIGFFGPVLWAELDDAATAPALTVTPGPGLVRDRRVFFESWALTAFADRLAEDPAIRRWFPPARQPHLTLVGTEVLRPVRPPLRVSAVDAAVLAACDGRRPAVAVVAGLVADGVVRTEADGLLALERLVERELLAWDAALPVNPDAEAVLLARVDAIGDPAARARAAADLDRLRAARDAVAAAAGDADALATALAALDTEFTALTGSAATREHGRAYAGRTVCYEDTTRDLDVVVGARLLYGIAEPLGILLLAARWLTARLGEIVTAMLRDLVAELAAAGGPVSLADVWYLAQGQLVTPDGSPVAAVSAEFAGRWAELFGLGERPDGPITLRTADLEGRAAALFAASGPGWPLGRVHSVDLQLCATDLDAVERGDHLVVLGELHPALTPFDTALFTQWHPERSRLRAAMDADTGPSRVRLLYPAGYPRYTGRTNYGVTGPLDRQLGVDAARGADPELALPATAVGVSTVDGELVATAPDGMSWPLLEVFSDLLCHQTLDTFKLLTPAPHTPRITVDRLVVARETWRTTVGETGLADVTGEAARYLAVRRWRARLGAPDRVFVKIGTETKPCYVDLTGPLHAQLLCTMLRTAHSQGGPAVSVTLSELLPGPEHAWLPDAAGRRYCSELRLQITDPLPYRASDPTPSPTRRT